MSLYAVLRRHPFAGSGAFFSAVVASVVMVQPTAQAPHVGMDAVSADRAAAARKLKPEEARLLSMVNSMRTSHKCPKLRTVPPLMITSQRHSAHMEKVKKYKTSGIGDGDPRTRAKAQGYVGGGAELVAKASSPADALAQWKKKRTDRAALVKCSFFEAGVSHVGKAWTLDMGTR